MQRQKRDEIIDEILQSSMKVLAMLKMFKTCNHEWCTRSDKNSIKCTTLNPEILCTIKVESSMFTSPNACNYVIWVGY